MARNQVIVSITGNASGLQKALGSSESALGKFGKVAGAVSLAAGAALVGLGAKSIKSASELEQSLGGLRAVFKDNAGQMEQWAAQAANSVGLAKSEYASLATTLGSQLKNMGVSTEQLGKQTNDLVVLGADLAAQFGGSTADAVGALSSLLRGERDPIERYGVSINEAAIKAKLAEMGLSGLSGEAEKNAKLQATLALLTQQTADAQGAFSRESTTLAGSLQRARAGTENLFATFGTALLPAVTAVTAAYGTLINKLQESEFFVALTERVSAASNAFADFVFGFLNGEKSLADINIGELLVKGFEAFLNARTAIINGILQAIPLIVRGIVTAVPQIVAGLSALIQQIVYVIATSLPLLLTAAVQLFSGLIQAVITVLPSVISALVTLIPLILNTVINAIPLLIDAAVQLFTALVDALPVVIPMLIQAVVDLLPKLVETVLNMIPVLLDAAVNLFTALVESIPVILPLLLSAIINLAPKLITSVISMLPKLLDAAVRLFTGLVEAVPKIVPKLVPALLDLAPKMIGALLGLIPQLIKAGIDLIGGLVTGLFRAAGSVGKALLDIAGGAVKGFLSFLGIKSPSRLFMGFGKDTVKGLVAGLDKNARLVDRSMDGLSSRVANGFSAELASPDLAFASAGAGSSSASSASVINVYLNTLNANAETGRVIVQSIREYEGAGGRL